MSEQQNTQQLPNWIDCQVRADFGEASALEQFIYDNEPAGNAEAVKFREGLAAVVAEVADRYASQVQPASAQPVAVPEGYVLVRNPITEDMHCAAVKMLHRAHGIDGLPQRMLTAMLSAAQKPEGV